MYCKKYANTAFDCKCRGFVRVTQQKKRRFITSFSSVILVCKSMLSFCTIKSMLIFFSHPTFPQNHTRFRVQNRIATDSLVHVPYTSLYENYTPKQLFLESSTKISSATVHSKVWKA